VSGTTDSERIRSIREHCEIARRDYEINLGLSAQPVEDVEFLLGKLEALRSAARDVYYAGHWSCDRDVDAVGLWTNLRDASDFEPGLSPKPLGEAS
jgi:hypothetical protein